MHRKIISQNLVCDASNTVALLDFNLERIILDIDGTSYGIKIWENLIFSFPRFLKMIVDTNCKNFSYKQYSLH